MPMKKNALKWKRANIIFPTDHIISSKAKEIGDSGFKPEYENKKATIGFLLSNEYMKLWYKDRAEYEKNNYSIQENAFSEAQRMKRRFVQHMMTNPKQVDRELPIIKLKRFQNIMSKVDTRRTPDEKIKICERYMKTFEPLQLSRYKPVCHAPKSKPTTASTKDVRSLAPTHNKNMK